MLAAGRRLDQKADGARDRRSPSAAKPPAELPAGSVDPGKPGPYRTVTGEYALDPVRAARLPDAGRDARRRRRAEGRARASVRSRCSCTAGTATCYVPGSEEPNGDWPCAGGRQADPEPPRLPARPGTAGLAGLRDRVDLRQRHQRPGRRTPRTAARRPAPPWCGCTWPAGPTGPPSRPRHPAVVRKAPAGRPVPGAAGRALARRRGRQPRRHGQPVPAARRPGRLPRQGALDTSAAPCSSARRSSARTRCRTCRR